MRVGAGRGTRLAASTVVMICVLALGQSSHRAQAGQVPTDEVIRRVIDDLNDSKTAWVASMRVRQLGPVILPSLMAAIQSGRPSGALAGEDARALALAKLGPQAVPAISERLRQIALEGTHDFAETRLLLEALAANGPFAIPALLDFALRTPALHVREHILERIVEMEPRREAFGQHLSALTFWRPQDDTLAEQQRAIGPRLPDLLAVMERDVSAWRPEGSTPQSQAAYLLARWGNGSTRERGIQVLEDLARANEPYYRNLNHLRRLHRLRAPSAARLINDLVPRLPQDDLGQRLQIATALYQLGDPRYAALMPVALSHRMPIRRVEAIEFVSATGDLAFVDPLIERLSDADPTGRTIVARSVTGSFEQRPERVQDVALVALQRLTFQELGADPAEWQTWRAERTRTTRNELLGAWLAGRTDRMSRVPREEANRWIGQLSAGPPDASMLSIVERYLRRTDLGPRGVGRMGGGAIIDGPSEPSIRLVCQMIDAGVPGARSLLDLALRASDSAIRVDAGLLLAMFDRAAATEHLARELVTATDLTSMRNGDVLLVLGDRRGIPSVLARLEDDQPAGRGLACRTLRFYTQQPLDCDLDTSPARRAQVVAAWRAWWQTSATSFVPTVREAALDEVASTAHNRFGLAISTLTWN